MVLENGRVKYCRSIMCLFLADWWLHAMSLELASERRYFTATMHDFMSPASMATHNTKNAWSRRHLIYLVELVNKIVKV